MMCMYIRDIASSHVYIYILMDWLTYLFMYINIYIYITIICYFLYYIFLIYTIGKDRVDVKSQPVVLVSKPQPESFSLLRQPKDPEAPHCAFFACGENALWWDDYPLVN